MSAAATAIRAAAWAGQPKGPKPGWAPWFSRPMTNAPATHIAMNASHGTQSRRHQPSRITAGTASATGPPVRASTSVAAAAASQYPAWLTDPVPSGAPPEGPGRRDGQTAPAMSTKRASTDAPSSQWYPVAGVKLRATGPPGPAGIT